MIRVDKTTLRRLRAGESVTLRHRTKRMMRHGQSYPLEVDGKPNAARVLVASAQIKKGSKYVWLLGCVIDREEPARFLAARPAGGELMNDVRDYTRNPHMAMAGEPEAVDSFTQRRITRDSRERERQAAGELIVAAEELRAALRDRIEASPEFMKLAGRDVWLIRSKLDRLVNNAKRRAA